MLVFFSARSAEAIMRDREEFVSKLEEADRQMTASGLKEQWYAGVHPLVRQVAGETYGRLLQALGEAAQHVDAGAVQLFRTGALCFRFLFCFVCCDLVMICGVLLSCIAVLRGPDVWLA